MPQINTYWTSVIKKIIYLVLVIFLMILSLKLIVFYMPFLIAFIIYMLIEPLIKWIMNHFKLSRKSSSIIVFIIVFGALIGFIIWGIATIVIEASNLLSWFNENYDQISNNMQDLINRFDHSKLNISVEIQELFENTASAFLQKTSDVLQIFLTNIIKIFTSIPTIAIYFAISVLSLYFICTDKIYMLDEFEHHFPEKWVKEISLHIRELSKTLGKYLKAQLTLVLISFVILLIGLYIMQIAGLNIGFPLLIALGISFVDALPILGSGTVMVPWAIFVSLNGDLPLGICIIILWIIVSITRQFIEPKIVSRKYWHTSYFYYYCYVYRV